MSEDRSPVKFRHEVVCTLSKWRAIEPEWNKLVERSRSASLFLTWEWLDSWMSVHDVGSSLFVICVRTPDGQLAGAAPFYMQQHMLLRAIPYRVLQLIGDVNSGAEYLTWAADAAHELEVTRTIITALRDHQRDWDLIWMPKLDWWSPFNVELSATLKREGFMVNSRPIPFSTVPLPDRFDAFLERMSANRRQQIRRTMRRILNKPGVEVYRVTTVSEVPKALGALFQLHNSRWQSIGHEGLFQRNPLERSFYERFVPVALQQGWLAMYVLTDHGEAKAVQLGYIYHGAMLQLQEGFDPDYLPHVGNALRAHVINDCINQGVREYDFLGGRSEHKRRWLAGERSGADMLIAPSKIRSLPIMLVGIWPTGAYLQPTSGPGRRRSQPASEAAHSV
jgi:CelD/BcsL family acetyltransferase involved in cellulose biosynthesis